MKKLFILCITALFLLSGCSSNEPSKSLTNADIEIMLKDEGFVFDYHKREDKEDIEKYGEYESLTFSNDEYEITASITKWDGIDSFGILFGDDFASVYSEHVENPSNELIVLYSEDIINEYEKNGAEHMNKVKAEIERYRAFLKSLNLTEKQMTEFSKWALDVFATSKEIEEENEPLTNEEITEILTNNGFSIEQFYDEENEAKHIMIFNDTHTIQGALSDANGFGIAMHENESGKMGIVAYQPDVTGDIYFTDDITEVSTDDDQIAMGQYYLELLESMGLSDIDLFFYIKEVLYGYY